MINKSLTPPERENGPIEPKGNDDILA